MTSVCSTTSFQVTLEEALDDEGLSPDRQLGAEGHCRGDRGVRRSPGPHVPRALIAETSTSPASGATRGELMSSITLRAAGIVGAVGPLLCQVEQGVLTAGEDLAIEHVIGPDGGTSETSAGSPPPIPATIQ